MEAKVAEATAELRSLEITEPTSTDKQESDPVSQLQRYLEERAKQQVHQCVLAMEVVKKELPSFQLHKVVDVLNGIILMEFQDNCAQVTLYVDVYCPRQTKSDASFSPGVYNVWCTELGLSNARISLEQMVDVIQKADKTCIMS